MECLFEYALGLYLYTSYYFEKSHVHSAWLKVACRVARSDINEEEESDDEDYDPAQDEEVSTCPSMAIRKLSCVGKSNML